MTDFEFKIQDLAFRFRKKGKYPVCMWKIVLILCTHRDSFSTSEAVFLPRAQSCLLKYEVTKLRCDLRVV